MSFRSKSKVVLTALAGVTLAAFATAAAADIYIMKDGVIIVVATRPPAALMVPVGTNDTNGQLHGTVREPGQYRLRIMCKTAPCPKFTATLTASNGMLRQLPDMTYELTVDRTPVTLSGAVKLFPGGATPR